MRKTYLRYLLACFVIVLVVGCIKEYMPPIISASNQYLVVEGVINATPDSPTIIRLSRTKNLTDTIVAIPESGASVFIEAENGAPILLQQRGDGIYSSEGNRLITTTRYRLKIRTSDSKDYQSEFVNVLQTPPIDSLNWKRDQDVTIYINTHSSQNNTRYYRWEFDESWEYTALFESFLGFKDGKVFFRDSSDLLTLCYRHSPSFNILLGSSVQLSDDIISQAPIQIIEEGSEKLGRRYSILARQYALDKDAYAYWQILQKNSQELGSIFDPQPSQLRGNIHCLTNPDEPVIGYVSASTVTEKRMFIRQRDIGPWRVDDNGIICEVMFTSRHDDSARLYFSAGEFAPYYYSTGGLAYARTSCVDCTQRGGSSKKPSFW